MSKAIPIDRLASEITQALREYTDDVSEAIADEIDKTAKECLAEVKANSPRDDGDYAKGWKIYKKDGNGYTNRTVWNKQHYRLVHLLEKGHAKRGGGRVDGRPHVKPAETKYVAKLEQRIPQIVRNGGE